MCDFLIDIVPREEAAKSQAGSYEQQQPAEYSGYYSQGAVPQYSQQQVKKTRFIDIPCMFNLFLLFRLWSMHLILS